MAGILQSIANPREVRSLDSSQLPRLAEELRETILETVSATGGHLASNLGAVELTIALLRVFTPPKDKVLWDVGHQTYSWKLLTGRFESFRTLRQYGGLSGFPKPSESPCDAFVAGHAGTALSAALGMAVARKRHGAEGDTVAVLGDGSLTNGITLEALNSLADKKCKVIVILNDNEMSISQNVGSLSRRLGRMLADVRYNRIKAAAEAAGHRLRMTFLRGFYHRVEQAIKSIWLQNAFFEEFGLRYVGPIDGHDLQALEIALSMAREYKRSVLIHVATQKGRGFKPAERNPRQWHGVGAFDLTARGRVEKPADYSQVFGESLSRLAEKNNAIVAITAAMRDGTGLTSFASQYPERFFDVGICESHAVVFAAGLAACGVRPVFAVYSTFLQRAVDAVMHDVCLQNLPVLFCVDRAGVVGADGPTHHGVFDIAMLRSLPNLTIMQPRDAAELAAMMESALSRSTPCLIRYPRGTAPQNNRVVDLAALADNRGEVVREPGRAETGGRVWVWALGDMVPLAEAVACQLQEKGVAAGVVNARFIKPLDVSLLETHAKESALITTIENGSMAGGFGSAVQEALALTGIECPTLICGWPDVFVAQGGTGRLMEDHGLSVEGIVPRVLARIGVI